VRPVGLTTVSHADIGDHQRPAADDAGVASVRDRDYWMRRFLVGADLLALFAGLLSWAVQGITHLSAHIFWGLLTLPVWIMLFNAYGLYAAGIRRVGYATVDDIPAMAHAFLVGAVAMWLYFQVTLAGKLVFSALLSFVGVAFVMSLGLRVLTRKRALRGLGAERVVFVGSGPMTPILVRQLLAQSRHGLQPLGVFTRPENERWPLPLPELGDLADVDPGEVLQAQSIDRVIVSAEGIEDDALLDLIGVCRQSAIKVSALPSLSAMMGSAATIDQLEGITLIGVNMPGLARSERLFKRVTDIVGAGFLLLLTAPLWPVIALAIKLDSPGPVFFRQKRIGRSGAPFPLLKFRSMISDAETRRAALLADSRQSAWLDLEHDPRITRTGHLLRASSLDELPQLWNVLRGEMSLVGPRPLIEEEDQNVSGWARGRLDLTPGITGVWQVLGRTNIPFDQMIMIDYLYVANWSVWTDIKLMLQTVPAILTRRGVN
jgi:exopolysaccharide biosynthesis polyprenyl glycosylphosphotransferase